MKWLILPAAPLALLLLSGCDDHQHGDSHDHDETHHDEASAPHGNATDDMNDFSGIVIEEEHGHEHDDRAGHDDHGAGGHGHDETVIVVTHFSDTTELFVEFPAFVTGQASAFAAHLTWLDNFRPVADGRVSVTLSGGGAADERFSVPGPSQAGIFRPVAVPKYPVQRRVTVRLQGEGLDVVHDLGEYTVYPSQALALAEFKQEEEYPDAIAYLKEQQWQVDFAITEALERRLRASIQATGTLRARADGEVYLSATSAGHLRRKGHFPYPGMTVERGQVLAIISPRLGVDSDVATLRAALDKARSKHQLAKQERQRLEKLWADKVVAERRLHEAESTEKVARAELIASEQRYKQATGGKPQGSASGVPVLAPISGILAQVDVAPGKYVNEGETLFHIVNVDRLWLEARIAEADIGRLQNPDGAWFTIEGFEHSFDSFELGGRTIALGGSIDPASRTAPLIFEFDNPDQRLRTGMFANVRVFTGETHTGVSVPASAIYDDGGQEVVYVMLGGESFQRRLVRVGIRDGDSVQIISGVDVGEQVVSRGAYLIRLASASPAEAGHGHAH